MIRIAIDEAAIAAAGLTLAREGDIGRFSWMPEEGEAAQAVASVKIEGDEMLLFPRRSAGQRELMQILGIAV